MKIFKKAFTLVELVVVVAVIAILTGISVAAYTGITARTKLESDKADVAQWNTLLRVEDIQNKINDIIEVKDYFEDQGYSNDNYNPRTNEYSYYWNKTNNLIYLVKDVNSNFDVLYPEDTNSSVTKDSSYNLLKDYCYLNSTVDGLTFDKNVLIVGEDNVVTLTADSMPVEVVINGSSYGVTSGKITVKPSDKTALICTKSEESKGYNVKFLDSAALGFASYRFSDLFHEFYIYLYTTSSTEVATYTITYSYNTSSKNWQYDCSYGTVFNNIRKMYANCGAESLAIDLYDDDHSENLNTYEPRNGIYTLTCNISITEVRDAQCIDENSLITMADGSTKAMKYIEIGDDVLSIDFDTMKLVSRKVIYTSKNEEDYDTWTVGCYYLHTFSDGTQIKRAMRHRFYCLEDEGYKHMDKWEVGLHGYHQNGTNPSLVSTDIVQGELHYARITLEGSNNYFANGLSTGDSECCPNKVTLNSLLEKGF